MELTVNGEMTNCDDDTTVATLLAQLDVADIASGVAVAVNNSVVPRARWTETTLCEGDSVEIIHAVQGG